ncbi:serine/threonine-protein kinase [Mycolicibacterium sp.]|uniref:serine/threonine-protein kinase n=1 Tax=Mycolicibacterium sp. TaxID=2320850 RepID=UPI0037C92ACE
MSLVEGQKFAGYTIVRRLGAGGMGEVYLTQHPRLPRRDALKVLPATVSADAEYRARFEREADLASTLWHPHIVGVHDRGEADGQLWLSMDFVDGHDAAHLIADHYPTGMPAADVVEIVTALASALDYAHQQGLLHRDVKPANIMLTNPGEDGTRRILLTDFGIARAMDDVSGLTATNMTVGTVDYCAPEQLMGDPVDGRTDQYALAATAYHLLTGTTLFPHTNPTAVIGRHLTCAPPRLGQARPELSAADPVLAAALAKEPEDRFARCSDFARALAEQIAPPQRTGAGPTTPAAVAPRFRTAPSNVGTGRPIQPTTQRRPLIAGPSAAGNATSSRRPTAMLVSAGATVLILAVVAAVMWWRPWAPTHQQHATATTTTPAPAPATSAPPPQPAAPSTPVPTAPPPAPDPYTYALPGCYFNGEAPQERPTVQPFQTCADGSRQLEDMTWSSWGKDGAQGTGVFSFNVCEPSCAQGHRAQFAVNVTASNPTPAGPNSGCPIDVRFYSDMIVAFTNTAPSPTEMPIDSTYLGRPAIRFTNSPNASGNGNLGNQLCY